MISDETEKFQDYLRTYSNMAEGSIKLYGRTISRFRCNYKDLTIKNMNEFISDSFRKSRSNYVKYAFKYYLKFKFKKKKAKGLYEDLVKAKVRPPKRLGSYHPKETVYRIINNIPRKKQKLMAKLQYALGLRAREVIILRAEYIDYNFKPGIIKITIIGKGDKEREAYLLSDYEPDLKEFQKTPTGFLFLSSRFNYADEPELETAINTERTYLYEYLRNSAEELGVENFKTHDLRKNYAQDMLEKTKDIFKVQQKLGHSDPKTTVRYLNKLSKDDMDFMLEHQKE